MENIIAAALNAHRSSLTLLGREFEFGSGVRAIAAEGVMLAMSPEGVTTPEGLFDACESIVPNKFLFENYEHACKGDDCGLGEVLLGRGLPLPSFEAYVALSSALGRKWVQVGLTAYLLQLAPLKYRKPAKEIACRWRWRAKGLYQEALRSWDVSRQLSLNRFLS